MRRIILKYIIFSFVLFVIFTPIIYLFVSFLFPNFQVLDLNLLLRYMQLSYDPRIFSIFMRTILIGLSVAVASGSIGIALAILLECTDISHRNFFRAAFFLPFLIPTYIFTFSWMAFLGKRGIFANIQLPDVPIDIYNPYGVVFFLVLSFFPIVFLAVSLGIKNIDRNLIDAGRIANSKKITKKILIPLTKPHIIVSTFFVFALAMSEYTVPSFLRVNTYPGEIFAQMAAFYNINRAVLYSLPMVIISLAISFLIYLYIRKSPFFTISTNFRSQKRFIQLSRPQKIIAYTFLIILFLISVAIPISMVLLESEATLLSAMAFAWKSIYTSITLSFISSIIITLIGFFVYNLLKENKLLLPLIIIPLILPASVLGVALINIYNTFLVAPYTSELALLIGYIVRFMPISVLIFMIFSSQISPKLEEVALLSEKNYLRVMRKIILPLNKGALISSFFIIFILSLTEVGITQMLSPPGFQTLSLRIETLMHYGNYAFVASLSLFIIMLILLLYTIYMVKTWKR